MKKSIAIILSICLLLCACSSLNVSNQTTTVPMASPEANNPAENVSCSDPSVSAVLTGIYQKNITNGILDGNMEYPDNWGDYSCSKALADNVMTLTGSGATASFGTNQNTELVLTAGHRYYCRVMMRVLDAAATKIELVAYGSSPIDLISSVKYIDAPVSHQWYLLDGVISCAMQTANLRIAMNAYYADATAASGKAVEIKYAFANDLSLEFGAGSEPTKEQMRGWLAQYDPVTSWFSGTQLISLFMQTPADSSDNLLKLPNYDKIINRQQYQIWKYNSGYKIMAIHDDVAVAYDSKASMIAVSTTGINGLYTSIVAFNATNFPGLISGSTLESILVLPWTRNLTTIQTANKWRMVVITNKGQVYHNYPARDAANDGLEADGDILKFDESVIWDLPERRYPSTNIASTGVETYFPGLPAVCYEYHPAISVDNGYGNGGFGKSITRGSTTYPRFYFPNRNALQNSMSFMSGYEPDDKISLIGTYKSNEGTGAACRICIFATDDAGRSWYNKYEFTSGDEVQNYGNPINTSAFATAYKAGLLKVSKRTLVIPSAENKEPKTKFKWSADITVSDISRAGTAIVTTSEAHGLENGNVIAFKSGSGGDINWDWMKNDTVGTASGGNGKFFRVKVLSATTFELYEFVHSAFNNIPCRHIHHINRVKDGWIIGSGEAYPEGWILYMQMKDADMYNVRRAYDTFPIIRLTSTATSVQRILGANMLDDSESTMIVAMDDEFVHRAPVAMPDGRTETFERNSTGIFRGKLADIDELSRFQPVFETNQVSYFFKKKGGAYIWIGQYGAFAISFDGITWMEEDIGTLAQHFYGESKKYIAIDNYIIIIK